MRVPKTELNQLLGALASAEASPPPAPLPPAAPAAAAQPPATEPAAKMHAPVSGDIRFELARALPALWAKAQRDFADGKAVREKDKLRDLLVWLLAKRNATVRQRQGVTFSHEGHSSSGRLDVVASLGAGPSLAIEVDWAYARASLEKLQAAHRQGMHVMWVCGAKLDRAAAKALRSRANLEFGPTYGWLFMFHLEHGWL